MDTLSRLEKAHYDPHTQTVFVVNMFEYQGQGPKNEVAAAKHLETLHNSHLISQFILRYPQIPYRYPIQSCPSVPSPVLLTSSPDPDLKSTKHSRLKNGAVPLPADWQPNESHAKLCHARGLELGLEAVHFKGKALELDWRQHDWNLKFKNWLLQEVKFRQRRP